MLSLQESKGLELDEFDSHLKPFGISRALLASLIDTFAHAKTFGSLIQIPEAWMVGLSTLADGTWEGDSVRGCVLLRRLHRTLLPLVGQATVLAMKLTSSQQTPPYMGARSFNFTLKEYLRRNYDGL